MMITQDTTEHGTQLEFRLRGQQAIQTEEFWGLDNGLRAREYLTGTDLIKTTDYHRYVPIQRNKD